MDTATRLNPKVFKGLLMTYGSIIMLNALDELKGTVMYSKKLHETLDQYSTLKQRGIYKQRGTEDQAADGSMLVEKIVYAISSIQEQPAHVQQNFDRELEELMIRYGVNMIEMESI